MSTIYVDADACPVKEEIYRVAKRYEWKTVVVANAFMRVPNSPLVELVVQPGSFNAADDWIAEQAGSGDIVVTADIPLAARSLEKKAKVLDAKGRRFTDKDIGSMLASRELMNILRQNPLAERHAGGPSAMTPRHRSNFLAMLDQTINEVKKEQRRGEGRGSRGE
jgi:uncharacterized protein YaiI (UPF0178 family)